MFTRRNLLIGGLATPAVAPATTADAHHTNKSRRKFKINPAHVPQRVSFKRRYKRGTIVVCLLYTSDAADE